MERHGYRGFRAITTIMKVLLDSTFMSFRGRLGGWSIKIPEDKYQDMTKKYDNAYQAVDDGTNKNGDGNWKGTIDR